MRSGYPQFAIFLVTFQRLWHVATQRLFGPKFTDFATANLIDKRNDPFCRE